MAEVLVNQAVSKDFYLMKVKGSYQAQMGQFCMLRAWDEIPVMSRPISIYDVDREGISFLYKVVGQGTEAFARLKPGDEIRIDGPYGHGFPMVQGKVALVGGGVGIAPLYYTAKMLKAAGNAVDCYLGFTSASMLEDEYGLAADSLTVNVGGYIVDDVPVEKYDYIFTCGPRVMMEILAQRVKGTQAQLYVSMENRMACGVGACLVCSCKTAAGNKKVCKDGPVFLAEEVFFDA